MHRRSAANVLVLVSRVGSNLISLLMKIIVVKERYEYPFRVSVLTKLVVR